MNSSFTKRNNGTNRSNNSRSGFSLLEILVVLAVFVMITALAMPSLGRAYQAQQLIGAADVVRARFAEARVKAIETGDVYGFFYLPGAGNYFLAPMVQGFRSLQSGQQPTVEELELKNLMIFIDGDSSQDSRSADAMNNATRSYDTMVPVPVLFYPDGTSQNAVVLIQAPDSPDVIQVDLRGLTGTSSRSNIKDIGQVQQ